MPARGKSLTSSREAKAKLPPKRIHRIIANQPADIKTATAALEKSRRAVAVMPCLNPQCPTGEPCAWPERGRPKYFCCHACRDSYEYERNELLADIAALELCVSGGGGTNAERRTVATELGKLRWALRRYLYDPGKPNLGDS